ncbi:hypothetical protein HDU98_001442 [Podochytrium sp. JEL0797]|nr:hypothetical protein HDU98_001442 [Podochytrium sp. JEL0797]
MDSVLVSTLIDPLASVSPPSNSSRQEFASTQPAGLATPIPHRRPVAAPKSYSSPTGRKIESQAAQIESEEFEANAVTKTEGGSAIDLNSPYKESSAGAYTNQSSTDGADESDDSKSNAQSNADDSKSYEDAPPRSAEQIVDEYTPTKPIKHVQSVRDFVSDRTVSKRTQAAGRTYQETRDFNKSEIVKNVTFETYHGFIEDPIDAQYVVEGVILKRLLPFAGNAQDMASIQMKSGGVVVMPENNQFLVRWRLFWWSLTLAPPLS